MYNTQKMTRSFSLAMQLYSIVPKDQIPVKGYGFLSLLKI